MPAVYADRLGSNASNVAYNVKDYGAIGDGSTSDTTAVQAAITAATAASVPLFFPAGTYLCGRLSASGYVWWFGPGKLKLSAVSIFSDDLEWIKLTGTSTTDCIIEDMLFDGTQVIGTARDSWGASGMDGNNESVSPYTNWSRSWNCITALTYRRVIVRRTNVTNYKRFLLVYNSTNVEISDNKADGYTNLCDNYAVVELATDLIFSRNELKGRDHVNAPASGVYSTYGILAWDCDRVQITGNNTTGHQIVVRAGIGSQITSVEGDRCIIADNIIMSPPADTACFGYSGVTATGNTIKKSGDWGLSFNNSLAVTCVGNVIDGTAVGGIYFEDISGGVVCSDNIVRDIAQAYANSVNTPSLTPGIQVKITSVIPKYVVIKGNSLLFATVPTSTSYVGTAISVETTSSDSLAVTFACIVQGNICHNDTTNLPDWVISVPEARVLCSATSGTLTTYGERIVGGTSGNSAYNVYTSTAGSTYLWFYGQTGPFLANETITGQQSSATWTVASSALAAHTGNLVKDNIDRYTRKNAAFVNQGNDVPPAPGFRLSPQSSAPVITSASSGSTVLYYTPYTHNVIPIWNGKEWVKWRMGELSMALLASSTVPNFHDVGKNFDAFVALSSSVPVLATGPAWTSDTARNAALARLQGLWTNNASIDLRISTSTSTGTTILANQALYVGSFRCKTTAQAVMTFGGSPSSGCTQADLLVWNAYNRVDYSALLRDSDNSWSYATATWRAANGSTTARVTFLRGIDEDAVDASYHAVCLPSNGTTPIAGIGLSTTLAFSGISSIFGATNYATATARYVGQPGLGYYFVAPIEIGAGGGTQTWVGDLGLATTYQSGLAFKMLM